MKRKSSEIECVLSVTMLLESFLLLLLLLFLNFSAPICRVLLTSALTTQQVLRSIAPANTLVRILVVSVRGIGGSVGRTSARSADGSHCSVSTKHESARNESLICSQFLRFHSMRVCVCSRTCPPARSLAVDFIDYNPIFGRCRYRNRHTNANTDQRQAYTRACAHARARARR